MKLTIYRDRLGKWRWKVTAANGRKLANGSEGYARQIDCERMAHAVVKEHLYSTVKSLTLDSIL